VKIIVVGGDGFCGCNKIFEIKNGVLSDKNKD